ncbi:SET domain-containing protein SmydA-8-like [Diorhabda carinulata]|uniref:SET domain-containing protein SmydA-8-like n=1 Tax=Diorhabda carinulata TaxID=1163345 RepID=UPI0025A2844A|nr:SET domain-containing protein SmydA-8-like [Diorhabda carinulata]XP_057666325.1 SET domain-containing protein SmydA-8-like [Diorhabda carinulata]
MSEETKCQVCRKPASNRCSGCHFVHYCSKEHQKSDWKQHKKYCKPFKVYIDETSGKYLRSTKDLHPGDVIFQETPLIWGPTQSTVPVCLGCGKEINENNSRPCSKCGWPMCSDLCEKAPGHIPECRYTVLKGDDKMSIRNFGIIHPSYQFVTILRILYQKQFLPEIWKKIQSLETRDYQRKNIHERDSIQIAKFILKFFKLDAVFTEDDVLKICGILKVYSHEVPCTDPPHVAIYEQSLFLEHSCVANCAKSFSEKGCIVITAGADIKKGGKLSICHTNPIRGTSDRRHHLYDTKLFWCCCPRCSDPTEFGTYFSALRCQDSNCKGYLLPKTFIDNKTNDRGSDWCCNECPSKLSPYAVQDLLDRIGKDLTEMPKDNIKECKNFIDSYEELLHPNHYFLTEVKIALINLIGGEKNGLRDVSEENLQLKLKFCQNLCDLFKQLTPGENKMRGKILYELQATVVEIGRRKADPNIVYASLIESKKLLEECTSLLKHELESSLEGKIYEKATKNLKELQLVLRTVHEAMGQSPV